MEEEKKEEEKKSPEQIENEKRRIDLFKIDIDPSFKPSLVETASIDQMISGHQLKYIENIIETEEELKLAVDSIDDLERYPEPIQLKAIEIAEKMLYDQDYLTRNKIDHDLYKPIQYASNIAAKKNEATIKNWKIEYHGRLIERLREFRKESEAREQQIKKSKPSFFQKLFKKN